MPYSLDFRQKIVNFVENVGEITEYIDIFHHAELTNVKYCQ
ncbi:IS630 transposase-related protein [Trichodesmium erythraeum]|nr:hypothetical protein [Trichodesmium erythraeum GBRTRLIN201]